MLPDVAGKDVIELGCGTAYFSAWLARRGARPVGVDITPAQLETARRDAARDRARVPADRGRTRPRTALPDGCADLVVSEYGASIWVRSLQWIPEASRLLRPGGELVFLRNSTLVDPLPPRATCWQASSLLRPQLGLHRLDWWDENTPSSTSPTATVPLLRDNGFEILDLVEL